MTNSRFHLWELVLAEIFLLLCFLSATVFTLIRTVRMLVSHPSEVLDTVRTQNLRDIGGPESQFNFSLVEIWDLTGTLLNMPHGYVNLRGNWRRDINSQPERHVSQGRVLIRIRHQIVGLF